jgi:hypothetical protein
VKLSIAAPMSSESERLMMFAVAARLASAAGELPASGNPSVIASGSIFLSFGS